MSKALMAPDVVVAHKSALTEKGFDSGENLYPFASCCCCVNSLYPSYPSCVGANCEVTSCCMSVDLMMCKPTVGHADHWCTCLRAQVDCHKVTVCIKSRTQLFCLDSRAAIPPDSAEVPCMISFAGLTCCYANAATCRCCVSLASLEAAKPDDK